MAKTREEVLEGLAAMRSEAEEPEPEVEAEPEEPTPGEVIEEDGEESDDEEESEEEESDDEDEAEDEEEDEEPEPEEEKPAESTIDKDIARLQEAEKESKQRIQGQIEELAAGKAESEERLAKAEQIESDNAKFGKQFKSSPVRFAKSQGLESPADFLALGATLYKYGKGMSPDAEPAAKEWAKSVEKEGEQASTFSELQAQIAELKAERDAEKAERESTAEKAETQRTLDEYASNVISEAGDDTPLAKAVLTDADEETKQSLLDLAQRMAKGLGHPPTPQELLEAIEEFERAGLKKRGIDPDKHFPKKSKETKAKPDSASKKKKAAKKKTKSPTKPRTKTREEILQGLRERNAAQEAHK